MRSSLLTLLLGVVFSAVASAAPSPVLTKGLANVRAEFNVAFPKRDKSSDGWIGDAAHQKEKSGHNPDISGTPEYKDGDSKNEVRAIDVDSDLKSDSGVTMEDVVQYLLTKLRGGTYMPFRYLIFNKRIWSKSNNWKQEAYTGASPHTEHLHISGDYGTAERTEKADEWSGKLGLASVKHSGGGGGGDGSTLPKYANGSRENSRNKNSKGTDVQTLQRVIGSKCGTADGIFGANTETCVKWYQGTKGLEKDGIAGPKTWASILKSLGRRLRSE
ncbi:hypothetical protein Poli38472_006989 [Pythium oligandrum]|uniref:Peptidoglycan binding-like domain-containing protein n=1 Tax=Pythium oligandrum TaxID=41045 RepID=A0A8K1FFC3_PYTOL|nr:hypothetical protein Poli38472_006989 [Pythium oligandrum]|eukprot:TMW58844.1 hypothetical protein Poli38472_006989 [Pythium oligandrum]